MGPDAPGRLVEVVRLCVDALGVLLILLAFGRARGRACLERRGEDAYGACASTPLAGSARAGTRVAGHLIRTVELERPLDSLAVLALIVPIRTFLSLSPASTRPAPAVAPEAGGAASR